MLKDGDSRVCEAAAFALEQMGSTAEESVIALAAAATSMNAGFCEVIDASSEASQKILLASGWTVRWAATRALGVVGVGSTASLQPLITALNDEEWQVRGVAALALGQHEMGNTDVVSALISGLSDEQAPVRKAAVIALGNLGELARPAISALRAAIEDDDASVTRAAEEALAKF